MRSRVYEPVERPSVRLSRRSTAAAAHAAGSLLGARRRAAGLLPSARGRRYRAIAGNVNVNVNVEFKVTLHERVRDRGTLQY